MLFNYIKKEMYTKNNKLNAFKLCILSFLWKVMQKYCRRMNFAGEEFLVVPLCHLTLNLAAEGTCRLTGTF